MRHFLLFLIFFYLLVCSRTMLPLKRLWWLLRSGCGVKEWWRRKKRTKYAFNFIHWISCTSGISWRMTCCCCWCRLLLLTAITYYPFLRVTAARPAATRRIVLLLRHSLRLPPPSCMQYRGTYIFPCACRFLMVFVSLIFARCCCCSCTLFSQHLCASKFWIHVFFLSLL